ncbi:hypothetical protein C1H46_016072 [Malus baccata]|uniref:Reverse transcriptase zinc-binding domain-containing protein n=1 Tax=Malus baccata TaxID=106549 RepID=A0A540MHN6_MALBA|nr:hypothetical protein C1H46_016072 [Malus baccata]
MMAWRIISDIVPTTDNLRQWRVPTDQTCILCDPAPESTYHLMECPFAVGVWRAAALPCRLPHQNIGSLKEWALTVVQNSKRADFECVLMLLWAIWTARNSKLRCETPSPDPRRVMIGGKTPYG